MNSKKNQSIDFSIIIPVFQNENSLEKTFDAIRIHVLDKNQRYSSEVIFVDDGSTDNSLLVLKILQEKYPKLIKIVKLTRNFGTYPAIIAGYEVAKGSCLINISADMQDPPELISEMLYSHFVENYNIVVCHRESRDESAYRSITSKIFYGIVKKYCFPNMPKGGFDFILISSRVKNEILQDLEADFFLQGRILWAGYDIKFIPYKRRKREEGVSQWTFSKKLKWFLDAIMGYSFFPIRFISATGILIAFAGFIYAFIVFAQRLLSEDYIYGWSPIVILILILSGLQLLMLGVIGEYIWRTLSQTRNRVQFVIDEVIEDNQQNQ